ncbi:MAG: hypothetical protein R6V15_08730 [Desulfotignum sp.]
MLEKNISSGLCANCIHAGQCGFMKNNTRPIIFCEEFSCACPEGTCAQPIAEITTPLAAVNGSSRENICSNCENLETCCLQEKHHNSVMCCKEYR